MISVEHWFIDYSISYNITEQSHTAGNIEIWSVLRAYNLCHFVAGIKLNTVDVLPTAELNVINKWTIESKTTTYNFHDDTTDVVATGHGHNIPMGFFFGVFPLSHHLDLWWCGQRVINIHHDLIFNLSHTFFCYLYKFKTLSTIAIKAIDERSRDVRVTDAIQTPHGRHIF